jgi:hypothetical protein
MSQLEGVFEVSASQRRIVKFVEGKLPQRDMDPQILVAGREGVAKGVARAFGIAGSPDLEALFQVGLCFSYAPGVNEIERARLRDRRLSRSRGPLPGRALFLVRPWGERARTRGQRGEPGGWDLGAAQAALGDCGGGRGVLASAAGLPSPDPEPVAIWVRSGSIQGVAVVLSTRTSSCSTK